MPLSFADLKADFELIADWEERYRYLIEIGEKLPPLTDAEKTAAHKVQGCMSQVWLVSEPEGVTYKFRAASDALIVQGLIAVLRLLFNNRPAAEVAQLDALAELAPLGLDKHLSPNRRNGLVAMVKRIQQEAAAHVGT